VSDIQLVLSGQWGMNVPHSPKIPRYVHDERHIHAPFGTRRAINAKKSLRAIRVRAIHFAGQSDIEAVCLTTLDDNLQTFVEARDREEVRVYVLRTG
jgi:hypothetical protein